MTSLRERLGEGEGRQRLISDACQVLDQEVSDKGGLSGLAIKGAYTVVKGIKPGFIPEVVDNLLDDFLDALEPLVEEAKQRGVPPGKHLSANAEHAADKLLAITDARVAKSTKPVISGTYKKLRPTAIKHVAAAGPRLGQMLDRHFPTA
ncbi:MAG: hypothetical protein RL685_1170 [Pseudomonadota bacterium]